MGIFDYFQGKKKPDVQKSHIIEDENLLHICPLCRSYIKDTFQYCPYCGNRVNLYEYNSREEDIFFYQEGQTMDETMSYLEKTGRSDLAEKMFDVRISVPGTSDPVTIQLYGACRADDAINRLYEMNILRRINRYYFTDWPSADPEYGPAYRHVPACVCELENRIYHIARRDDRPFQVLYGCPGIYELDHVPEKSIEVIDYE